MIGMVQFSCGCGTQFTITRDRLYDKMYSGFICPNCNNKYNNVEKLFSTIVKLEELHNEAAESDWKFRLIE